MSAGNEQAKGRRGGLRRTSWKPGIPSPNPGGRPRSSYRASEAVRELVQPEEWVAFELGIARDEKQPIERRAQAWHSLIDRGFCRPPVTSNVNLGDGEPEPDLSKFTPEQLEQWLALDALARAQTSDGSAADPRLPEPPVTDDDSAGDTFRGTPAPATPRNSGAA